MPRGRKKKAEKVVKAPKIPAGKINDINPNDKYIYDPKDAYGSKLR